MLSWASAKRGCNCVGCPPSSCPLQAGSLSSFITQQSVSSPSVTLGALVQQLSTEALNGPLSEIAGVRNRKAGAFPAAAMGGRSRQRSTLPLRGGRNEQRRSARESERSHLKAVHKVKRLWRRDYKNPLTIRAVRKESWPSMCLRGPRHFLLRTSRSR